MYSRLIKCVCVYCIVIFNNIQMTVYSSLNVILKICIKRTFLKNCTSNIFSFDTSEPREEINPLSPSATGQPRGVAKRNQIHYICRHCVESAKHVIRLDHTQKSHYN